MSFIKNFCLGFAALFVLTIAYCLIPPGVLDVTKKFEAKNEENCKIVDGPRGFEDQTYWNKKVMIST